MRFPSSPQFTEEFKHSFVIYKMFDLTKNVYSCFRKFLLIVVKLSTEVNKNKKILLSNSVKINRGFGFGDIFI